MADGFTTLMNLFGERLDRLPADQLELLNDVDVETAHELAARAVAAAMGPLLWGRAVGERLPTPEAVALLGVSRQALNDRVRRHTVLGVPGRGVTWFPAWQFDREAGQVKSAVGELLEVFYRAEHPLTPLEVAAWATQPSDDLDDMSPAEWIAADRPAEPVLAAACHTAARAAA